MNLPTRRTFLASAAGLFASQAFAQTDAKGLEPFDKLMEAFLADNKVPGAALAVARGGKIVHARGYGFADVEAKEPVKPDSLFRIASVSKPITAVAVMQLLERGRLELEDPVLDLMGLQPLLADGAKADERWQKITVRHCLQHTGGWDRDVSYDPIVKAWDIAKAFGAKPPVTPEHVVRYMMGKPLDFEPGERYAYSNLGYLVLGRIVEKLGKKPYEQYIQEKVFKPLGITTARLGKALVENRAKGEVRYYDSRKGTGRCLYPPKLGETVPTVYGAMNLEAFEAHGGWIASAIDLAKFAAAFDDPKSCPILGSKVIEQMGARPPGKPGTDSKGQPRTSYYACGWQVRQVGGPGRANYSHSGYIPGTEAILVRRQDGLNWAVLFNTNNGADGKSLAGKIEAKVHDTANEVKDWPRG